ncbi:MAG: hypothetical protein H0W48_00225 [Methylibium sp.]|nr:hypothetical protein [Methylibium sp.]
MSDTVFVGAIAGAIIVWGFVLRDKKMPKQDGDLFDYPDVESRRYGTLLIGAGVAMLAYLAA